MTRIQHAMKTLKIPAPIAEFTISPEDDGFVFEVKIFKSPAAMRKYLRHIRPEYKFGETWSFVDNKTNTLITNLYDCTDNTISHECHHLTSWFAYCKRLKPNNCMEWGHKTHERLAEVHGNLVSQFWKEYTKGSKKPILPLV